MGCLVFVSRATAMWEGGSNQRILQEAGNRKWRSENTSFVDVCKHGTLTNYSWEGRGLPGYSKEPSSEILKWHEVYIMLSQV